MLVSSEKNQGNLKLILSLRGGLGNQLFQVFAGAHFAKKFDAKLVIDDVHIVSHVDKSRRAWSRKINFQKLFPEVLVVWPSLISSRFRSKTIVKVFATADVKSEIDLLRTTLITKSIKVQDWFISAKYLPPEKTKLQTGDVYDLDESVSSFIHTLPEKRDIAAIHIRLGDFKRTNWGVLTQSAYLSALFDLSEKGISRLDCFSDNIEEAREIIRPVSHLFAVRFPEVEFDFNPHELLWTLTNYRYFVSSNSTLSWWASYFNVHSDALIYGPWRGNLQLDGWTNIA
jgi:hypothetical protein